MVDVGGVDGGSGVRWFEESGEMMLQIRFLRGAQRKRPNEVNNGNSHKFDHMKKHVPDRHPQP